jgi:ATP-dependent DNA ligase
MSLPLRQPYPPMEATSVDEIPVGSQWQYEPKWDGFRCVAFRDGSKVELQSKAGESLTRYFPELVDALAAVKAERFVIDGEIVVPEGSGISFDALLLRIHPAASRVAKLAAETPARLVVFDLLVDEHGKSLAQEPVEKRRPQVEAFAARFLRGAAFALSPASTDLAEAKRWFAASGGALDGIVAKRLGVPYGSGHRHAMVKIKQHRTVDCVVGGFRYASKGKIVGSLLLGLYDDQGELHHVGFTSSLNEEARRALTPELEKLVKPPGFTGRAPGGPSRWSTERSAEWKPLATRLVAEVTYDHFTGGRFRHGTKFLRFRPDKKPRQCTFDQVEKKSGSMLKLLGGATRARKPATKRATKSRRAR